MLILLPSPCCRPPLLLSQASQLGETVLSREEHSQWEKECAVMVLPCNPFVADTVDYISMLRGFLSLSLSLSCVCACVFVFVCSYDYSLACLLVCVCVCLHVRGVSPPSVPSCVKPHT